MDQRTLSELLECSVCLEQLDSKSKVLPCQHTFCRRCLDEIVSTKHELRCPECRLLVDSSVDSLPSNILLIRLLDGIKNTSAKQTASTGAPNKHSKSKHRQVLRGHRSSTHHHQSTNHNQKVNPPSSADSLSFPPNTSVKAIYSYVAKEVGDLSFEKGDIITLKKKVDENWYHGQLNDRSGYFPATYVQIINQLPSESPQCIALYDFILPEGSKKDCLTFRKHQNFDVLRRIDENWAEGRIHSQVGIFPVSFVQLNDSARRLMTNQTLSDSQNHLFRPSCHLKLVPPSAPSPIITNTQSASSSLFMPPSLLGVNSASFTSRALPSPSLLVSANSSDNFLLPTQPSLTGPLLVSVTSSVVSTDVSSSLVTSSVFGFTQPLVHSVLNSNSGPPTQTSSVKSTQPSCVDSSLVLPLRTLMTDCLSSSVFTCTITTTPRTTTTPLYSSTAVVSSLSTSSAIRKSGAGRTPVFNFVSLSDTSDCNVSSINQLSLNFSDLTFTTSSSLATKCSGASHIAPNSFDSSYSQLSFLNSKVQTCNSTSISSSDATTLSIHTSIGATAECIVPIISVKPTLSLSQAVLSAPSVLSLSEASETILATESSKQPMFSFPSPAGPSISRLCIGERNSTKRHSLNSLSAPTSVSSFINNRHSAEINETVLSMITSQPHSTTTQNLTLADNKSKKFEEKNFPTAISPKEKIIRYIALFHYKSQRDDELDLKKGDYLIVEDKCQDGWYRGRCLRTGATGVFPGNYVQKLRPSSTVNHVDFDDCPLTSHDFTRFCSSSLVTNHSVPTSSLLVAPVSAKINLDCSSGIGASPVPSTTIMSFSKPLTTVTPPSVYPKHFSPTSTVSHSKTITNVTQAQTRTILCAKRVTTTPSQLSFNLSPSPLSVQSLTTSPDSNSSTSLVSNHATAPSINPMPNLVESDVKFPAGVSSNTFGDKLPLNTAVCSVSAVPISSCSSNTRPAVDSVTSSAQQLVCHRHLRRAVPTRSRSTKAHVAQSLEAPDMPSRQQSFLAAHAQAVGSRMTQSAPAPISRSAEPSCSTDVQHFGTDSNLVRFIGIENSDTSGSTPRLCKKSSTFRHHKKRYLLNQMRKLTANAGYRKIASPTPCKKSSQARSSKSVSHNQTGLPDNSKPSGSCENTKMSHVFKKCVSSDSNHSESCLNVDESAQPMETYLVVTPYPPQTDVELELRTGDAVLVYKKREDGWFRGMVLRTGKTGLFPGTFVEPCRHVKME